LPVCGLRQRPSDACSVLTRRVQSGTARSARIVRLLWDVISTAGASVVCPMSAVRITTGVRDKNDQQIPTETSASKSRRLRELRKRRKNWMAERVGFEPTVEFPLHTLSKRAPSTTRTSLPFRSTTYGRATIVILLIVIVLQCAAITYGLFQYSRAATAPSVQ
jgi:hypothetical protein